MKKRTQFIIRDGNIEKRKDFYNYIINKYNYRIVNFTREEMINSNFPFVVDHKEKVFWICKSISCLAIAAQNGLIITIDEFKKISKGYLFRIVLIVQFLDHN